MFIDYFKCSIFFEKHIICGYAEDDDEHEDVDDVDVDVDDECSDRDAGRCDGLRRDDDGNEDDAVDAV